MRYLLPALPHLAPGSPRYGRRRPPIPLTFIPSKPALLLSGFSPEAVKFFQEHVSVMGLTPVAGLGGSAPDGGHVDACSLRSFPGQP